MKGILEFSLPEEFQGHQNAVHASRAFSLLRDIDEKCRQLVKYGDERSTKESLAGEIRSLIRDEFPDIDER